MRSSLSPPKIPYKSVFKVLFLGIIITSPLNLTTQSPIHQVLSLIEGNSVYDYALRIEELGLDTETALYSFRSGGSAGATASAHWIYKRFQSLGLESRKEIFCFLNWNLYSKPQFTVDIDGDTVTLNDRVEVKSFTPLQLSWPSPRRSQFKQLIVYSPNSSQCDLTDRIVLVGLDELRIQGYQEFHSLALEHPPYAVVYTYFYRYNSQLPPVQDAMEGKFYWQNKTVSGWISFEDGVMLKRVLEVGKASARIVSESPISFGPHYNIVGEIMGEDSERTVIFSAHYDTVMTPGFIDNGAGVAGLLELAKAFSFSKRSGIYTPHFNLRFIAFASEEIGLLGSINYVNMHRLEMEDVVAVINLDSIGSRRLKVIDESTPLGTTAIQAAVELGVPTTLEPKIVHCGVKERYSLIKSASLEIASDHLSFEAPSSAQAILEKAWPGYRVDIADVRPVPAITLSSRPIFPRLIGYFEKPGWIHTPYDNSTTPGWGESDNLEGQVKVAALTAHRLKEGLISDHRRDFQTPLQLRIIIVHELTDYLSYDRGLG